MTKKCHQRTLAKGKRDRGGTEGFYLKLFQEYVGYEGADGGPHSCTLDLFIILTLEEEVSVGEAELQ